MEGGDIYQHSTNTYGLQMNHLAKEYFNYLRLELEVQVDRKFDKQNHYTVEKQPG